MSTGPTGVDAIAGAIAEERDSFVARTVEKAKWWFGLPTRVEKLDDGALTRVFIQVGTTWIELASFRIVLGGVPSYRYEERWCEAMVERDRALAAEKGKKP